MSIYELGYARFNTAPGLVWQTALNKTKVNLCLLSDIEIILMVIKGIRRGICYTIHRYAKLIANTWKITTKVKNCRILSIGM